MHEVSVMASIIEAVLAELQKYDVERVEEVDMVVGELTFLGPEQLEFAYSILIKNTILEGSDLVISTEKVQVRCAACGYEGGVEYIDGGSDHYVIPDLSCPKCGGRVEIIKGKSCSVNSLKVVER
jgi:hydrogenase nickel incorporation protein HypA/HybF